MTTDPGNVVPLFDVAQLVDAQPVGGVGRVERACRQAITKGVQLGIIGEEHLGLAGGALAGARALDVAERGGKSGGPYATAALLTPYRETLAALGLVAVTDDGASPPAAGHPDAGGLLGDLYGTATN